MGRHRRGRIAGRILAVTAVGALTATLAPIASGAGAREADRIPPPVFATIETGGLNVLHSDFRLAPGEKLVLPPGMPEPVWITLPDRGTFTERVAEVEDGPLGDMKPGTLYWIRGTRLGIYQPTGAVSQTNILEDRFHPTGTVSAAIGREHGTNPDALGIFIADANAEAWAWLVKQSWIDAISTSYYTIIRDGTQTCPENRSLKGIVASGKLMFSAAGNVEQIGMAHTPAGSPYTYQVGGVDDEGRSYFPGPDESHDGAAVMTTRPYETGDRFDFPSADADSLEGSMDFGGTSGATPSTAGRATELLHFARTLLDSRWTGVRDGALAIAGKKATVPGRGPLSDGRLDREEMTSLLHHVAIPAEAPSPFRYLIEGYGALNEDAVEHAKRVLAGTAVEPQRPDEDAMHEQVEPLRAIPNNDVRCG